MTYDEALASLLALRDEFQRIHIAGTAALEAGDDKAFSEAIEREKAIIEAQRQLLVNLTSENNKS